MSIYEYCPIAENDLFRLKLTELSHCVHLLKVYSDVKAVPFFNSDNCGGDDFYYTTYERMKKAIEYWQWEYSRKGFVRLSIIDIKSNIAVGTVEMFKRVANDYFTDTVLLRLDLRSDYENGSVIQSLISLVFDSYIDLFDCKTVSTKAIPAAKNRIAALTELGFVKSDELLIGHDGTLYSDYYVFLKADV